MPSTTTAGDDGTFGGWLDVVSFVVVAIGATMRAAMMAQRQRQQRRGQRSAKKAANYHAVVPLNHHDKQQVRMIRKRHFSNRLSISYENSDPLMIMEVRFGFSELFLFSGQ